MTKKDVRLTMKNYQRLTGERMSLLKSLEQEGADADFVFDPPRLEGFIRPPSVIGGALPASALSLTGRMV